MKISKNGQLPLLGIMGLREAYLSTHISRDLYCTFFIIWWLLRCFDGKAASPRALATYGSPPADPRATLPLLNCLPSLFIVYLLFFPSQCLGTFQNPLTVKHRIAKCKQATVQQSLSSASVVKVGHASTRRYKPDPAALGCSAFAGGNFYYLADCYTRIGFAMHVMSIIYSYI